MSSVVDTYELSPMQAGRLFHGLSAGDAGAYIEQVVATLPEALDEAQFLGAWQRLAERHPVLRSRFRWEGVAQPVQDVLEHVQIPAERLDWRALVAAGREQRFQALLEREQWVLWTTHHGFLDRRSRFLLWQQVFTFYEAFLRGEDVELPLPPPYRDYIEWLRKFDHDSAKTYWQGVLSGYRAPTPLVVARDREAEHVKGDACGSGAACALAAGGQHRVSRAHRPSGQDSRFAQRTVRDRSGDRTAPGDPRGVGARARGHPGRQAPDRLPAQREPACRSGGSVARAPARRHARIHGSGSLRSVGCLSAHTQRQARSQGAAGARRSRLRRAQL
jgi:hypothetical protein